MRFGLGGGQGVSEGVFLERGTAPWLGGQERERRKGQGDWMG